MNIQELCRLRKEELKLTYHDISDASGVPLSTVQNFFSKLSKAPSIYTVAPICKALGISLDEIFGISEHPTVSPSYSATPQNVCDAKNFFAPS